MQIFVISQILVCILRESLNNRDSENWSINCCRRYRENVTIKALKKARPFFFHINAKYVTNYK